MFLEDITMEDFKRGIKETKTLILSLGTVEEHGRHLPLSTDALVVYEIVRKVEEKIRVFIAPPIHYGVCTSTSQHPGTVSITFDTLRAILRDIVLSSYDKGMRNFILISGHAGGSHMTAMKEAGEGLIEALMDSKIAVLSVYDLILKEAAEIAETENDSHAGEIETSMVMALAPQLVRGRSEEEYPNFPKPLIVKDKIKHWPGGVWGDPKKAAKEKGEKLVDIAVNKLIKLVREIEKPEIL